jgi:hypothetical protein
MKKTLIFVSCVVAVLVLSQAGFAQFDEVSVLTDVQPLLSIEDIVGTARTPHHAPAAPHVLPFGYPPYPTVDGNPAFGVPYSYPRAQRRFGGGLRARLALSPFQPHPLPPVPAMYPEGPGTVPMIPEQPVVFYRPTPVKNFMMMLSAPRPYMGYDPYAGYPPFPGYIPPQ